MRKWTILAGGAALAVGLVLAGGLTAADDKAPTIKEIMTKAHKGGNSLLGTIRAEVRKPSPDYDKITPKAAELAKLGPQLAKNNPPKGDKESWEKLCKEYETDASALNTAVGAKDGPAAQAAVAKIGKACAACHKVHKED
jgi:hypothetical protein